MWSGFQTCGKQCFDQSYSCFYTRTTGIWQPVWLEAVGSSYIENISIVPDPDNSRVFIDVKINGGGGDLKDGAVIICYDEDTEVYINGQKILGVSGFTSNYRFYLLTDQLKKVIKKGSNTFAIHNHQVTGSQYIDLAIIVD